MEECCAISVESTVPLNCTEKNTISNEQADATTDPGRPAMAITIATIACVCNFKPSAEGFGLGKAQETV